MELYHINISCFSKRLMKILQQQFLYIIGQLVDVCWDINQSTISDVKQRLLQLSVINITDGDIHIIINILTSQTVDCMATELLADVEKSLLKCLALFRECSNMSSKDVTGDLQYMLACEKLKTYLSMAEVLLYDPVSPVDYIMYHTVKHDCLQRVVSSDHSNVNSKVKYVHIYCIVENIGEIKP